MAIPRLLASGEEAVVSARVHARKVSTALPSFISAA